MFLQKISSMSETHKLFPQLRRLNHLDDMLLCFSLFVDDRLPKVLVKRLDQIAERYNKQSTVIESQQEITFEKIKFMEPFVVLKLTIASKVNRGDFQDEDILMRRCTEMMANVYFAQNFKFLGLHIPRTRAEFEKLFARLQNTYIYLYNQQYIRADGSYLVGDSEYEQMKKDFKVIQQELAANDWTRVNDDGLLNHFLAFSVIHGELKETKLMYVFFSIEIQKLNG
jgi:hypothetical protein